MAAKSSLMVKPMLLLLGLIGVSLNLLVFLDLPLLQRPISVRVLPPPPDDPTLRAAVYLVKVPDCAGLGVGQGTAFAVHDEYLVTCAHVVSAAHGCASGIQVRSSAGLEQAAELVGYSEEKDLALLKVTSPPTEVLVLADSSLYEEADEVVRVFTVGFPLLGAASSEERSSFSGVGTVSGVATGTDRLITSGLNVNPGNSGGPVLLEQEKLVLGVASAKLKPEIGEGIAYIVPSNAVKAFFRTATGEDLE